MNTILVDTCIWIDHLGRGDELMATLLAQLRVVIHQFIIGEIALGSLADRQDVLNDLYRLPTIVHLNDADVDEAIEQQRLFSTGIGYVDAHLVVSTLVTPDLTLWTRDNKLLRVTERLGIAAKLTN